MWWISRHLAIIPVPKCHLCLFLCCLCSDKLTVNQLTFIKMNEEPIGLPAGTCVLWRARGTTCWADGSFWWRSRSRPLCCVPQTRHRTPRGRDTAPAQSPSGTWREHTLCQMLRSQTDHRVCVIADTADNFCGAGIKQLPVVTTRAYKGKKMIKRKKWLNSRHSWQATNITDCRAEIKKKNQAVPWDVMLNNSKHRCLHKNLQGKIKM